MMIDHDVSTITKVWKQGRDVKLLITSLLDDIDDIAPSDHTH